MAADWTAVTVLAPDTNLDMLVLTLNRLGIVHRITREDAGSILWVASPEDVTPAQNAISQLERTLALQTKIQALQEGGAAKIGIVQIPITLLWIVLGLVGASIVFIAEQLLPVLTFQAFTLVNDGIRFAPAEDLIESGEWWRLITPTFLHFGLVHVIFNCLWMWELGRQVEWLIGPGAYFFILLSLSVGANVGQYISGGPGIFGGLSGVVYGLLGYIWVRNIRRPHPVLKLLPGIIPIMLGLLVLGLLGVIDKLIPGQVANGAHISGLLIGMFFGAFAGKNQSVS